MKDKHSSSASGSANGVGGSDSSSTSSHSMPSVTQSSALVTTPRLTTATTVKSPANTSSTNTTLSNSNSNPCENPSTSRSNPSNVVAANYSERNIPNNSTNNYGGSNSHRKSLNTADDSITKNISQPPPSSGQVEDKFQDPPNTKDIVNSISNLTLGQNQGQILPCPPPNPSPLPSRSQTPSAQLSEPAPHQTRSHSISLPHSSTEGVNPNLFNSSNTTQKKAANATTSNVPQIQIRGQPANLSEHRASIGAIQVQPQIFVNQRQPPPRKPLKLLNHAGAATDYYDNLYIKAFTAHTPNSTQNVRCTEQVCLGSIVSFPSSKPNSGTCRPAEEVKGLAKDFFDQYYTSIKRFNSTSHKQRWEQVLKEIDDSGTYNLTETELVYGAKLAWRNSVRCIGRIQWAKLQVFDARSVTTTTGMFEAVCKHIKYATNKGNIRSAITIFPQRTDGKHDFRIWNPQIISYAGYRNPDGTILGDPVNVEFTEVCMKLGWKGKSTKWDLLPLVLSANGHDPEYFEIPSELILEVSIIHPNFDWFPEMGIRWYALPAVSGMLFDCGGLEFTAAPFNGWYMGTEIGCRDLGDVHRYNVLEEVAVRMGLDTKNPTTLWKDRAMVELNLAVLFSYQKAGVTVVDHHSASESFMKHYENEMRTRGGCPADWVWIIPPMSGSATPVFHQEMALYHLKPNYEYQEGAWKTHVWKKSSSSQRDGGGGSGTGKNRKTARRKFHFKEIARAVKFTSKLFGKALSKRVKATILYGTETGKSEMYARRLGEIFGHAFNSQVYCMDNYDIINIEHETLILVVTSTFGNGDPPENGESFAHSLYAIKMNQGFTTGDDYGINMATSKSFIKMNSQTDSVSSLDRKLDRTDSLKGSQMSDVMSDDTSGPLRNITFAVFALGSSAYPNFCAFGRYVDNLLGELGGERLMKLTTGDELAGQDQAFRTWAAEIFNISCESFCLDCDKNMAEISAALKADTLSPEAVRFLPCQAADEEVQALSKLHNRKVANYTFEEKANLHEDNANRVTIKVVLKKKTNSVGLSYHSGDHVGIMAENRSDLVDAILSRLINKPESNDEPVQLQLLQEKHTPMGIQKQWIPHERLPRCSLRQMFTRYLDITTPPRPNLILYLVRCSDNEEEKERLNLLGKDSDEYEHWKQFHWPNLATVLEQFPSVHPDATVLSTMLPLLQPRFYSVSSSPVAHQDELHLTVAVVTYNTRGGDGPVHYGVCSNYLNDIQLGTSVPCFVRSAVAFHMPADTSRPLIMVGPGTGIAPFRGFWQERKIVSQRDRNKKFGKMTLFFGCRTKEMILYRSELETMKEEVVLSDIYLALSREPSVKKTYVQDLMVREGESIARQVLDEGGHVYVCGDCTMAEDVYQTLKAIVQDKGLMNDNEVESYMFSLRDDNRYHEDIFGITHRTAEVHEKVRQTALTRIESNYTISNASGNK